MNKCLQGVALTHLHQVKALALPELHVIEHFQQIHANIRGIVDQQDQQADAHKVKVVAAACAQGASSVTGMSVCVIGR